MTDPLSDPFNPGAVPAPDYEPGRGDPEPTDPGPEFDPEPGPVEFPEQPSMAGA